MAYQKNTWVLFEYGVPAHEQPDAFITKDKLDHIETGIRSAVTDFKLGSVSKGTDVQCEIISDDYDPSIKRMNLVIPKEVSWLFSQAELIDNSVAPTGATYNDMVLDDKGNIFTIAKNENGVNILRKRLNIMGKPGEVGPTGPEGKAGIDGINGIDGIDGNKWIFTESSLFDGEEAPENSNVGDFIMDTKGDIFEILDTLRIHKLFNIHGEDGKSAYQMWLEEGNTGTVEQFFTYLKGPAGDSTYDLWKRLGYEGTPQDFLDSLKGDSIASKKLTTLDEVLENTEEGMFVDALMVKEMYLKLQEQINKLISEVNNNGI